MNITKKESGYGGNQRGQVLIEFSLIAVTLSLLIALVVDVARMVFIAQVLQETARVAARELSLLPLSPVSTFEQALQHPQVKSRIYDPSALIIEVDHFEDSQRLDEFLDGLPIVNRMLRPLMTFERIMDDGRSREVLRFPGIVLGEPNLEEQQSWSIGIPHTETIGMRQGQNVRWKSVLEEIRKKPGDPNSGSFSLQTSHHGQPSGLVALRVNYPFQPMFMNWIPQSALPDSMTLTSTNEMSLQPHGRPDVEQSTTEVPDNHVPNPATLKTIVAGTLSDYQRVLSAQAVFRREVFQ